MKVYLTLDYELFLGHSTGTPQKCLIATLERITAISDKYGAKFTIFVDATYLLRLRELSAGFPQLKADYDIVKGHLCNLADNGHSLQLHVHPQWAYSEYDNNRWKLDCTHYKLSDIPVDMAQELFARGAEIIKEICGKAPVAFRAGGFSARPTSLLIALMEANGIIIDSSVYPGNVYHSEQQDYDYSNAPEGKVYRFAADICTPDANGPYIELPLSTAEYSPLFYWKLVLNRLCKKSQHRRLGDGQSVKTTKSSIISRLTKPSMGFATIDESKIDYMMKAYKEAKKRGDSVFCVIGHPKLSTEYSLLRLDEVLKKISADGAEFRTVDSIICPENMSRK